MNRPLRIAIFVGCFPVVSETFILRQITGLLDQGHDVDIYADVAAATDVPVQSEVTAHGLRERTTYANMPPESAPWEMPVWPIGGHTWLPGSAKSIPNWRRVARALPVLVSNFVRSPRLVIQLLRVSEYGHQATSLSALYRLAALSPVRKQYDVLHAHFGPIGNSYRFVKNLWRAPLMVSFHGYDFSTVPQKSGGTVYRRLFQALDLATVNSNYMGEKLKHLGCPPARICKLAYGIDTDLIPYRAHCFAAGEPIRVLTVGRLTEKKGIGYSIRAFAKVRQTHPQITYDVIGDGPLRPQLQKLIEELTLTDCVVLHGAKTGNAVRQMLSQTHIFILSSVTASDGDQEGTPVSLLEAQAAGIPVLSTWHSGIPEIVRDGETGFLSNERDAAGLAERLNFLVEHPETCVELGRNGRRQVMAQFDSASQLEKLTRIYWSLKQPEVATPSPI